METSEKPVEPIVKQIGKYEKDKKWIVANRFDGSKLKGPFDTEDEAYASLRGKVSAPAD